MKSVTEELLKLVSNWKDGFKGAFNIREDGGCAGRQSTEHIQIDSKKDLPGLDIHIQPGTKGETVSIPASPMGTWTTWCTTTSMWGSTPT